MHESGINVAENMDLKQLFHLGGLGGQYLMHSAIIFPQHNDLISKNNESLIKLKKCLKECFKEYLMIPFSIFVTQ